MKIVVLEGSPNRHGSSNMLADCFRQGAEEAGHTVEIIDAAQRKHMRSALLAVAWNSDDWTFEALESHYKTLVRYLNLQDMGMVLGRGCGAPSMTQHSPYTQQAYELGNCLK